MTTRQNLLLAATATGAAAVLAVSPLAIAATPAPDAAAPPSIVQLCAATGVEEIDELLGDVARTQLVDELSPLLTLLVPDSETVELDASVQLADVRDRLNCADSSPEPTETPDPTVEPEPELGVDLDDGLNDERAPAAPAPTVVDADLPVTG